MINVADSNVAFCRNICHARALQTIGLNQLQSSQHHLFLSAKGWFFGHWKN
jgi:hypothetical protein